MIADLQPYPLMKDSGVPWLGAVPEHWDSTRLGNLVHHRTKQFNASEDTPVLSLTINGIRVKKHLHVGKSALSYVGHQLVTPGELVFTPRDFDQTPILSGVATTAGCISNLYFVVAPKEGIDIRYVNQYLWGLKFYVDYFRQFSEGMRYSFSRGSFNNIPALIPPLSEQSAIVRFLDHVDRRIRRYIRAKQRLIKLLEEQKQVIIHRAVTRGLDPNVRLRSSGVEWLGDVPEHWRVMRLKRVATIQGGYAFPAGAFGDVGIPVVRMNNIRRGVLDCNLVARIPPDMCKVAFSLQEGDVLYGLSGSVGATGSLGNYAVVSSNDIPAQLNQRVARIQPVRAHITKGFLLASLKTQRFYEQVLANTTGTAQFNVSTNDIGNVYLALPPLDEQNRIISGVEESTASISATIDRSKRETALHREYHTRLVADVVTGKLDVREAAVRLPKDMENNELLDGTEGEGDAEEVHAMNADETTEEAEG